jgi:hypothetical protein
MGGEGEAVGGTLEIWNVASRDRDRDREWLRGIVFFALLLMAFVWRQNDEPCAGKNSIIYINEKGPTPNRPFSIATASSPCVQCYF